jgi:hypothetical protein
MRSFSGIFIRYVDIFLTYHYCSIFELHSEMYILECDGDDFSSYIEHLTHHRDTFLIISPTDIYECCEEDISDLIASYDSLFSFEAILEKLPYHISIFGESCDRTTHISWREDAVFITDSTSSSTIISDRDYSRDIIVEIALESIKHIECSSSTSDSDDIDHRVMIDEVELLGEHYIEIFVLSSKYLDLS